MPLWPRRKLAGTTHRAVFDMRNVAIDEYLPIVIRDAGIGMAPAPCQDWSAQSNCKLCAGRFAIGHRWLYSSLAIGLR